MISKGATLAIISIAAVLLLVGCEDGETAVDDSDASPSSSLALMPGYLPVGVSTQPEYEFTDPFGQASFRFDRLDGPLQVRIQEVVDDGEKFCPPCLNVPLSAGESEGLVRQNPAVIQTGSRGSGDFVVVYFRHRGYHITVEVSVADPSAGESFTFDDLTREAMQVAESIN